LGKLLAVTYGIFQGLFAANIIGAGVAWWFLRQHDSPSDMVTYHHMNNP